MYVQLDDRLAPDWFADATKAGHDHDGYLRLTDDRGRTVAVVAPGSWQWYRIVRPTPDSEPATSGGATVIPIRKRAA